MPVDSGTIAAQTGASAGLWTHTPVDWRGNETGAGMTPPGGWPTSPYVAVPPDGSRADVAPGEAPSITAISVTGITTTGATINFTVQPAGTNQVEYGTTLAYGSTNTQGAGSGPMVKPLTGLTTGTLYNYRIRATANDMTTYSSNRTFTTA